MPGMVPGVCPGGLPHSEIRVSQDICSFTRLIAACHVLLRLREPRHPSCALLSFPFSLSEKSPLIIIFTSQVVCNILGFAAARSRLRDFTGRLPRGARIVIRLWLTFYVCCVARDYLRTLSFRLMTSVQSPSVSNMSMSALFRVVPGRVELPTSTLSV